jgi:DNA-binding XRE family transcriptional regulator
MRHNSITLTMDSHFDQEHTHSTFVPPHARLMADAEARFVGHEPDKGQHKGRLGALLVELPNGVRFAVGAGLSDAERFGFAVKVRREELKLTQEDVADKSGIHCTRLSDVERSAFNLSLVNIDRLAQALAISMSELFRLVDRT